MKAASSVPGLLGLMLWLAATAWGQAVPGPITGEMPAAGFAPGGKLTNLAIVSLASSSIYDDNFSNSASGHEGGEQAGRGGGCTFAAGQPVQPVAGHHPASATHLALVV